MQSLKVGHVFVFISGQMMVDIVCFPEVGDRKFMKTKPYFREMPLKSGVFSGTSGS